MLERDFFQNFKIGSLMSSLNLRFGIITSVNESKNNCTVFLGSSESSVTATYPNPYSGNANSNIENAWGVFAPPTEDSIALVLTFWGVNYILAIFPPENVPEGNFENWRSDKNLNVNRLPIAESDQREDAISTNDNNDLVKRGELFLRSSGLADILLDYIGNILLDTHKQITFRLGDRDSDNKISTPEIQVDIGRIVDDNGSDTNNKIQIKVYSVSGGTQTEKASLIIDQNGKITFDTVDEADIFENATAVNIADGSNGAARKEDAILSDSTTDASFWAWIGKLNIFNTAWKGALATLQGSGGTPAGVVTYATTMQGLLTTLGSAPTSLTGKINAGSDKVTIG